MYCDRSHHRWHHFYRMWNSNIASMRNIPLCFGLIYITVESIDFDTWNSVRKCTVNTTYMLSKPTIKCNVKKKLFEDISWYISWYDVCVFVCVCICIYIYVYIYICNVAKICSRGDFAQKKPSYCSLQILLGDRGGTVVKVLCYKSEGRWFDPSWCHWKFSLT